jgi:MarR family transcriptional regulator, organic hydroperoxide resistance regulator
MMPITSLKTPRGNDSDGLPDVLQFMQLLWAVAHGLERASKRMTSEFGVTGPQRLALRVVGLFPGLSAGELAAVLHLDPSTLTGVLQRLVGQRLLMRMDDPLDRRRAVLRLTARGARVNAVSDGTVEAAVAEALDGISGHARTTTRRVLQRVAVHLSVPPSRISDRVAQARMRPGVQAAGRSGRTPLTTKTLGT